VGVTAWHSCRHASPLLAINHTTACQGVPSVSPTPTQPAVPTRRARPPARPPSSVPRPLVPCLAVTTRHPARHATARYPARHATARYPARHAAAWHPARQATAWAPLAYAATDPWSSGSANFHLGPLGRISLIANASDAQPQHQVPPWLKRRRVRRRAAAAAPLVLLCRSRRAVVPERASSHEPRGSHALGIGQRSHQWGGYVRRRQARVPKAGGKVPQRQARYRSVIGGRLSGLVRSGRVGGLAGLGLVGDMVGRRLVRLLCCFHLVRQWGRWRSRLSRCHGGLGAVEKENGRSRRCQDGRTRCPTPRRRGEEGGAQLCKTPCGGVEWVTRAGTGLGKRGLTCVSEGKGYRRTREVLSSWRVWRGP